MNIKSNTEPRPEDIWKLFTVILAGHLIVASFLIDNIFKWVFLAIAFIPLILIIFDKGE